MKRFLSCIGLSLCLMALASCAGVDSQIVKYESALKENKVETAAKILDKLDNENLTHEQRIRVMEISKKYAVEDMSKLQKMLDTNSK